MRGSSSFPTSSASPQSVPLQALLLEKAGKAEGSDWHPSPWVPERFAMIVGQNHQHNIFIFSVSFSPILSSSLQFSPALSNSLLFNIIFLRIFAYVPSKSSSIGLHEAFSIIFPPSSCPSEGEPSAGLCGARGTGEQELQGCGGGRIDRETSLGKRSLDWFTVEL